jgi:holliday junction DNA helicase RuvA
LIGRVTGTLAIREADRVLVDTAGGVGYEVIVPARTLVGLPPVGSPIVLVVHTKVREDAITLYGFLEAADRTVFRLVQGVTGIGPKLALALVGTWEPQAIAQAVAMGDVKALTKVPGLGKKTAERLCLELKDKILGVVTAGLSESQITALPSASADPPAVGDTTAALAALGYHKREIDRALKASHPVLADTVQSLLKRALKHLSPS